MNRRVVTLSFAVLLAAALAPAIDKDARMIDAIGIRSASHDDVEERDLFVEGEQALVTLHKDWSLVVGLSLGEVDPDNGESVDSWGAAAGVRHYLDDLWTVALLATYKSYDLSEDDGTAVAGVLETKYRLVPVEDGVSPFVALGGSYASYSEELVGDDGDDTQWFAHAGAGCDLLLTDGLALVVEAAYRFAEDNDASAFSDGLTAGVSLKGYWD